MNSKYSEIVKHIPSLEDHGHLYMYYGTPYSEECYVYGDDEEGEILFYLMNVMIYAGRLQMNFKMITSGMIF